MPGSCSFAMRKRRPDGAQMGWEQFAELDHVLERISWFSRGTCPCRPSV